jgi:hypothetical protein
LLVVLYRCENLSLTIREVHRLKVLENRALRRIFGNKMDDKIGGWGILHNEELHIVYSSENIIRMMESSRMRWTVHVARMGAKEWI